MSQVLVLNGPNLNLLGRREPGTYGHRTLADIEAELRERGEAFGLALDFLQSNHEGALVDRVQAAGEDGTEVAIINPGAFTHTGIALRDAFLGVSLPFVEVHLSNIHRREPFRHHSYFSDIALGTIVGLGPLGYTLALDAAAAHLAARAPVPDAPARVSAPAPAITHLATGDEP